MPALAACAVDGPRSTDAADSRCSHFVPVANRIECRGASVVEGLAHVARVAFVGRVVPDFATKSLIGRCNVDTICAGVETLANRHFITTLYSLVLAHLTFSFGFG